MTGFAAQPAHRAYDVVIVGGGMLGCAVAWFLSDLDDFTGKVLVVERDPSYAQAATTHTNSCMRQQFSTAINIAVSQFAADYVKNFRDYMGGDARVPDVTLDSFGYMYLADNAQAARNLRALQRLQADCGAGTRHMERDEIAAAYPFYNLDDILAANHNRRDEGYFDGHALFHWWQRKAREAGVEFVADEVVSVALDARGRRVEDVALQSGGRVGCGALVNAAGTRATALAAMAGIALPVEPRKRYTYVFSAEQPLDQTLPLTIDPSGVHVRSDGARYMAGCPPEKDEAVNPEDFEADHDLWERRVWPALAHRIPAFEAIRLHRSWVGHYDYNTLDRNAVIGPHERVENLHFANGFSGHGLQQSPAMGRGLAELLTYGAFRSLDLSPFGYARIAQGRGLVETAVI